MLITIPRKDTAGTVQIIYSTEPWKVCVVVKFVGTRKGVAVRQTISTAHVRQFGELLAEVGKVKPEDRAAVVKFCTYLFFNMTNRVNIWLKNAEEVSAALLMVADIYDQAGKGLQNVKY